MAKKAPTEDLTLNECKEIVARLKMGFDTGMALLDTLAPEGTESDEALDGILGALNVCRGESPIDWLREVLRRVRAERDKPQAEMEFDGDEEG